MECLFCKLIDKEIPSKLIYEDDLVVAFNDINPQAPVHFLIVPKEHIASNDDINEHNSHFINHIFTVAKRLAKENGLDNGYRIVNNCRDDGGQTVNHIHFHVLGGRQMLWPPG